MARILYATFDPVPGPKGASRHVAALMNGLTAAGHEVDLMALAGPGAPARVGGARLLPFSSEPGGNFLARAGAFGEAVLAQAAVGGYDLWHVRNIWEGLPLALWRDARGGGPPLVWEANGLPTIEAPAHFAAVANAPALLQKLRRQEELLMRAADRIVVVSPVTASCLAELGADPTKIRVVPNGVDLAAYRDLPAGDSGPEVLYVGTLAPWQGLEVLVRALVVLPPPTRVRLVGPPGKGWARGLRKLAAALGVADRLRIEPAIAPAMVPAAIARARVCVAPLDGSTRNLVQGCCPLKLLEYAAAGKAIVASNVPPVEALFTHEQDAWLVPPDDPRALAAGLARLLADAPLRTRLGAAAQARAADLSWDASNAKVLAAYAELGVT